jgi:general secretion pathway protein G
MMLTRINKTRQDEGFTLIELLIVIVILGILAAIVVFAIGSTRGDAVSSSCKTDYKSIELAGEAYKTKTGNYPPNFAASQTGTLLKSWPGGSDYTFTYDSTTGTITVVKTSSNAVPGGAGVAGCG